MPLRLFRAGSRDSRQARQEWEEMKQTPQELEVWYVLPGIRSGLADELKRSGLSQKEIAQILGISEPAVSQYVNSKRARHLKLDRAMRQEISESARRIIHDRNAAMRELQRLCRAIRGSGALCSIHRKRERVPEGCCICMD